jgi:hypothetical protein
MCIGSDRVVVSCRDGKILVSQVITMAQQIYQGAHQYNNAIPVAYLRCGGAILNSGDILADVVENQAVLVAWTPENEPADTTTTYVTTGSYTTKAQECYNS